MIQEIGIRTARQLIDFTGGDKRLRDIAEYQLEGAVALHNILVRKDYAYLADEVGMGKTYTALGTAALFKHFNPGFRVLYIAPRQNIQEKWLKELKTFIKRNWRIIDNRVKSYQNGPAYGIISCNNLKDFIHHSLLHPHRDFILRLTSFSLPLSDNLRKKRDEILNEIDWINVSTLNLFNKDEFKENYARIINSVIPDFDLVIIDEGHNLKHGIKSSAARNTILAYSLGHRDGFDKKFPNYRKKFRMVLFLSATPMENDYVHIWNQIDLLGFGDDCPELEGKEDYYDDKIKEDRIREFLIRRISGIKVGDKLLTKNMYRREWRHGGVIHHDDPLSIPDEKQKLIVGLIQKKVSEVLNSDRFMNSFQIGMLSSFESFMQTSKAREKMNESIDISNSEDDIGNFDNSAQTESQLEKEGIDTNSIDTIATSYHRRFGSTLPHPKMDQVVDILANSFSSGEKQLVFVRRVASVFELSKKLNRSYDNWIHDKIINRLPSSARNEFEKIFNVYLEEQRKRFKGFKIEVDLETTKFDLEKREVDEGEISNFFTWFFRGEGPKGIFSGASFNKNKLISEGSVYSTFFEENYCKILLGNNNTLEYISKITRIELNRLIKNLRNTAFAIFTQASRQKKFPFKRVYLAYQEAIINLLAEFSSDVTIKEKAGFIRRLRFNITKVNGVVPPDKFPNPDNYINLITFFTEVREQPALKSDILPEKINTIVDFLKLEKRRELLSAVARLGQPMIDLWLLAVNTLKSIDSSKQERVEGRYKTLIKDFITLLIDQKSNKTYGAYVELSLTSKNLDILLAINFPEVKDSELSNLSKIFGIALSKQSPVRGMAGGVNKNFVRQFRMPGYPLTLVTTEVLQEGEDLHTFCSNIYHYGIAWNPSSMEQRTGRIDRIHSLTHRRLQNQQSYLPEECIQVYYPHLRDTVEVLQIERVFERMNKFIRMMHRSIKSDDFKESTINTNQEILSVRKDIATITDELKSAFPVKQGLLHSDWEKISLDAQKQSQELLDYFHSLMGELKTEIHIEEEPALYNHSYLGTVFINESNHLVSLTEDFQNFRRQPFELLLEPVAEYGKILLTCISPIGKVPMDDVKVLREINQIGRRIGGGKICVVDNPKIESYNLTVEANLLFNLKYTQYEEVFNLLERTVITADLVELNILASDMPLENFSNDLSGELLDDDD